MYLTDLFLLKIESVHNKLMNTLNIMVTMRFCGINKHCRYFSDQFDISEKSEQFFQNIHLETIWRHVDCVIYKEKPHKMF